MPKPLAEICLMRSSASEVLLTAANIRCSTTELPRRTGMENYIIPATKPSSTEPQELTGDNLFPFSEILTISFRISSKRKMDLGFHLRSLWARSRCLNCAPASQMQSLSLAFWFENCICSKPFVKPPWTVHRDTEQSSRVICDMNHACQDSSLLPAD